jgi:lysozyme family protein
MTAPPFDQVKHEYAALWAAMTIPAGRLAAVDAAARRLVAARARYQAVERATGVPWFVVAAIHERESGQSWHASLAQGDPWDRRSVHVPAGRGPFASWEDAAVDALRLDHLDKVRDWSPERCCYELELYNGFGYRRHGIHSPYLWSVSSNYRQGKFVADGQWSTATVDRQIGCMPLIRRMMALDPSIAFAQAAARPVSVPSVAQPRMPAPAASVPPSAPSPRAPAQTQPGWLRLVITFLSILFKRRA